MQKKVLIIEDDRDLVDLISIHLRDLGYDVKKETDGVAGLENAIDNDYDLVILDLMLPGMEGFDVCKGIREQNKTVPILMLTSRAEELDKVIGLELGADDYITKPFSIRELMARVKANIRSVEAVRKEIDAEDTKAEIHFGEIMINRDKRKVTLDNQTIDLTAKEFDLLLYFATSPGRSYTREDLLNAVWGYQFSGYDHTVNSHINRLRGKIEKDPANPKYIKTVWGVGYRFAELEELEV